MFRALAEKFGGAASKPFGAASGGFGRKFGGFGAAGPSGFGAASAPAGGFGGKKKQRKPAGIHAGGFGAAAGASSTRTASVAGHGFAATASSFGGAVGTPAGDPFHRQLGSPVGVLVDKTNVGSSGSAKDAQQELARVAAVTQASADAAPAGEYVWKCELDGVWTPYSCATQIMLEDCFRKNQQSSTSHYNASYRRKEIDYVLDATHGTQTRVDLGTVRPIKRCFEMITYPPLSGTYTQQGKWPFEDYDKLDLLHLQPGYKLQSQPALVDTDPKSIAEYWQPDLPLMWAHPPTLDQPTQQAFTLAKVAPDSVEWNRVTEQFKSGMGSHFARNRSCYRIQNV